jgi:hypothetical protein
MALQKVTSGCIANGSNQSIAITLNELTPVGIIAGSTLSASGLSFLGSVDGINFYGIYDKSSEVLVVSGSAPNASARSYSLDPMTFFPYNFIKVRMGSSASSTVQAGSDFLFSLNTKKLY